MSEELFYHPKAEKILDDFINEEISEHQAYWELSDLGWADEAIDQKLIGEITGNKPDGAVSVPTPNSLIILMLALWFVLRPSLNIKTVQEAL